ncbi:MAG: ABC transporter ATP-binding protein, partial [Saprospiraceae bacterium]|nr:ABC transporter ATP-binding protein [Saprospiraceae bacterium]
ETQGVNKYFKKPVLFHILKDINLHVKQGEFVSIMGKSGCGKSTLLYILSTMDTDYEGALYLNGDKVTGKSKNELSFIRNKEIGFIFQFHYLLPEFSVIDNIMMPALKLGAKEKNAIIKDAKHKLEILGIAHLEQKKASMISGGEKQRVAIARALINDPSIIMGDEPTGNLDSKNSQNVFNILRNLSDEQNLSLLVVTHDSDFAQQTDRVILMEDGKIMESDYDLESGKL